MHNTVIRIEESKSSLFSYSSYIQAFPSFPSPSPSSSSPIRCNTTTEFPSAMQATPLCGCPALFRFVGATDIHVAPPAPDSQVKAMPSLAPPAPPPAVGTGTTMPRHSSGIADGTPCWVGCGRPGSRGTCSPVAAFHTRTCLLESFETTVVPLSHNPLLRPCRHQEPHPRRPSHAEGAGGRENVAARRSTMF